MPQIKLTSSDKLVMCILICRSDQPQRLGNNSRALNHFARGRFSKDRARGMATALWASVLANVRVQKAFWGQV